MFLIDHKRSDFNFLSTTNLYKNYKIKPSLHSAGRLKVFRIRKLDFSFFAGYRITGSLDMGSYGLITDQSTEFTQLPETNILYNHLELGMTIDFPLTQATTN